MLPPTALISRADQRFLVVNELTITSLSMFSRIFHFVASTNTYAEVILPLNAPNIRA